MLSVGHRDMDYEAHRAGYTEHTQLFSSVELITEVDFSTRSWTHTHPLHSYAFRKQVCMLLSLFSVACTLCEAERSPSVLGVQAEWPGEPWRSATPQSSSEAAKGSADSPQQTLRSPCTAVAGTLAERPSGTSGCQHSNSSEES